MLLLAYGALLDLGLLLKTCPGARTVARARLLHHRLAFPTYSNSRRGGVSGIVPAPGHSPAHGCRVRGLPREHAARPDRERRPDAFR
jgi:hypothetical protein